MRFYIVTPEQLEIIENVFRGANIVESSTLEIIKRQMVDIAGDGP